MGYRNGSGKELCQQGPRDDPGRAGTEGSLDAGIVDRTYLRIQRRAITVRDRQSRAGDDAAEDIGTAGSRADDDIITGYPAVRVVQRCPTESRDVANDVGVGGRGRTGRGGRGEIVKLPGLRLKPRAGPAPTWGRDPG